MSFPIDPTLDEFAAGDCLTCYAAGKTPKYLYACFSGIEPGNLWVPGVDLPPPNGIHRLEWSLHCDWGALEGNIGFAYQGDGDWSRLQVFDPWDDIFSSIIRPACTSYFENSIINPIGNKYYGGFATIASTLPGSIYSISDIAEAINYERTPDSFAVIHPKDEDQSVNTLYEWNTNSRIKILYDHT